MSYRELNFDDHNMAISMSEVKEMFRMHFGQGCRYVAKRVYDRILAVDFDSLINAGRYQRSHKRQGHRNGYRRRSLLTSVGALDLKVPRDREGKYQPSLFARYKRVDGSLEETIRAMFLRGVSTRKVGHPTLAVCSAANHAGRSARIALSAATGVETA
jgi:putative transposase